MSITFLLPLVAVATSQPSTVRASSPAELERLLADGMRDAVARGFTLANVDSDGDAMTFLLVMDGVAEKHVVVPDHGQGGVYRVEHTTAPKNPPVYPQDSMLAAMLRAPRGGLELETDCGYWYDRAYLVDEAATGIAAARLVATTLATLDDLEWTTVDGDRATFHVEADGRGLHLVATLAADGRVTAAELRRFEYSPDQVTYARRKAMRRAIKGRAVTAIRDRDGNGGVVLELDTGKTFEIDPEMHAFVEHPRDAEEGCGC